MGTSKIMIDGVGIDLTADTVAEGNMLSGVKAHDANGDAVTGTILSQGAQTINPALSPQTIAAGKYLSGNQTIAAITKELLASLDADFVAENIKKDVDLFGLIGTLESGGAEIASGKVTFAEDTVLNTYYINHGLSGIPNIVHMVAKSTEALDSIKVPYAAFSAYITKIVNPTSTSTKYYDGWFNYVNNIATSSGRSSATGGHNEGTGKSLTGEVNINSIRMRIDSTVTIPAGGVLFWLAVKTGKLEGE